MKTLLLLFVIALASCNTQVLQDKPIEYSMMPPYVDVEVLLPAWSKDSTIKDNLKDFSSLPVDSGCLITVYKDTMIIPGGVLISDKKAAQFVFLKSNYEQQLVKIEIYDTLNKTYYRKSLEAEKVYQAQIKLLQQDVKRTWLEKNIVYMGFGAGLLLAILTEWAVLQVK